MEVERLDKLKASKMKEIAFKKQAELEDIFACTHIEIDTEAARAKIMALTESDNVEPAELLAKMDDQIAKAKEEASSRKEILDKIERWTSACEEESWLDDYNRVCVCLFFFWQQSSLDFLKSLCFTLVVKTVVCIYKQDKNRYNACRGAHLNLKHAEKARILVNKIPGISSILEHGKVISQSYCCLDPILVCL